MTLLLSLPSLSKEVQDLPKGLSKFAIPEEAELAAKIAARSNQAYHLLAAGKVGMTLTAVGVVQIMKLPVDQKIWK